MRPGSGARSEAEIGAGSAHGQVPEPAIYEVRAIGVKLSAHQNRRRWHTRAVNPSGFHPETLDRPAIFAKRCFVEADQADLGRPVPCRKIFRFAPGPISRI